MLTPKKGKGAPRFMGALEGLLLGVLWAVLLVPLRVPFVGPLFGSGLLWSGVVVGSGLFERSGLIAWSRILPVPLARFRCCQLRRLVRR